MDVISNSWTEGIDFYAVERQGKYFQQNSNTREFTEPFDELKPFAAYGFLEEASPPMIMPPPLGQFMTLEEFTDFYNHAEEWVDKFVSHKFGRNAFYFEEEPEV